MEKLSYKLPVFEGPLDLLLHLITKNKLNIYDILSRSFWTSIWSRSGPCRRKIWISPANFWKWPQGWVHLKSVSLLPKHEEPEALKQDLTRSALGIPGVQTDRRRFGSKSGV